MCGCVYGIGVSVAWGKQKLNQKQKGRKQKAAWRGRELAVD